MAGVSTRKNEATWVDSRQRWQIKVQKDGDRKTFTSSTPGKKGKFEAERKADKWLSEGDSKDIRFEKLWAAFLEETKLLTSFSNYAKHEQMGRLWLLPTLKNKRGSSITQQDWQNCINAAYKAGKAKKTLTNIRASATAVSRYARKNRHPIERPADLTIPADALVKEKRILQPDQLKTLMTVDTITVKGKPVPCHYIHYWRALVLTGLRPGEMAGLRKGQDIKGRVLTVRRAINNYGEHTGGKNANARRDMVLTKAALGVFAQQEKMLKALGIVSPWVFPAPDGGETNPKQVYHRWRIYREQHGITSSLYELRHTLVSMAKADVPEQLLKRIVGHSDAMDTFGVYGHDVDGDLERAADMLDGVFSRLLSTAAEQ